MPSKPSSADAYRPDSERLAREACLYIATKLGDLLDDIVIVGGLVPTLLCPPEQLPPGGRRHVGTLDVDLGLALAILDDRRYHELCQRLRQAGFVPDQNDSGRTTSRRWKIASNSGNVTVDFLIPETPNGAAPGRLQNLEEDFAAIVTPGLELAFADRRLVQLEGKTPFNEHATRQVWVCDAAAFVILKALAFEGRGENKDAYDLVYVLQTYGTGVKDVFAKLEPLLDNSIAASALAILERDFSDPGSIGPRRVATFLGETNSDELVADAAGVVRALLNMCPRTSS